jgi:hypothetical protein
MNDQETLSAERGADSVQRMVRRWPMFAHDCEPGKDGRGRYRHIGARRWVELHGLPHPIVAVDVIEDADGGYWGWLDTEGKCPEMIWPSRSQFSVCFAYGPEAEVARGKGAILRLRVEASNASDQATASARRC